MSKIKDLTGQKFGRIIPICYSHSNKHNRAVWLCNCECGNVNFLRNASDFVSGNTKSCGCLIKSKPSYNNKSYQEISGEYFAYLKRKDRRRRDKNFSLTIEELWNLFIKQNRKCALSGIELKFQSRYNIYDQTASLDRIDSLKDYTIDNVQWVHKDINLMKLDHDQKDFINYCHIISDYQRGLK